MYDFTVNPPKNGERADQYVMRLAGGALSRGQVHAALAEGRLLLRGRRLAKGDKLCPADAEGLTDSGLSDWAESGREGAAPNPAVRLSVVYEDEALVGLNKPAGMAVQPIRPDERETLVNGLLARFPEMRGLGGDALCPAVVHRIDIETSGLVLAARTGAAWRALRQQFRLFQVRKTYLAVVEGRAEAGRSDVPLTHASRVPCRMRLARPEEIAGRTERRIFAASTSWHPLRYEATLGQTLLAVEIRTGVTHQIRCHLAAAGHPIVGDAVYGHPAPEKQAGTRRGQLLHSWKARLQHPLTGQWIEIVAPPQEPCFNS